VSEVCHRFDPLPQILKNVRYRSGKPLDDADVKSAIDAAKKRLNGHGRLLVRSSGTEPVIRVMGEGDDRIWSRKWSIISSPRSARLDGLKPLPAFIASQPVSNGAVGRVRHREMRVAEPPNLLGNHALNKPVVVSEEALVAPVLVPELTTDSAPSAAAGPAYVVLGGISLSHFLNDTMQSLIPSVYPILKESYALDFAQIGLITLAFHVTASLLQPVVGHFTTGHKAQPFSLSIGMGFTFFGLFARLSVAQQIPRHPGRGGAGRVGLGSVPSGVGRIARLASGGRYGFAQSVFQVGGSFGSSMGPVLAALIVVPFGQPSIAWFSLIAFLAIVILWRIGLWYRPQIARKKFAAIEPHPDAPDSRRVKTALAVLVALLFSKQLYVSRPVELLYPST